RANLLGRKIDDGQNLLTRQFFFLVQISNLRTGFFDADLFAEINLQSVSRPTRLGKLLCLDNRTDTNIDLLKVPPINQLHHQPQTFLRVTKVFLTLGIIRKTSTSDT